MVPPYDVHWLDQILQSSCSGEHALLGPEIAACGRCSSGLGIVCVSWFCLGSVAAILQAAPNRLGQEDNNEGCSIGRIVELKRLCGSSDPETSKLESKTCSFPTALRKYIALSRKQSSPEVPEPIRRLVRYYLRSCWFEQEIHPPAKQARRYDYLYPSQGLLTVNDS